MEELVLSSDEARKYVKLIGSKMLDSITYDPIFFPDSKTIALVQHRALGENKCFDTVFLLRKTEAGIMCKKILDARNFILVPAKKRMIDIDRPSMRIDGNNVHFTAKLFTEDKMPFAGYNHMSMPLSLIFRN